MSVCQIISAFNAYLYYGQSVGTSLLATMQGFAYILLFPLMKSRIKIKDLEKVVQFFAICYLVVSLLNRISSITLFGTADEGMDRGITRFRVVGIYWLIFFLFMKINSYVIAADYFLFDCPRNTQQLLFGHGVPSFGNSNYGKQYESFQNITNIYREDVGFFGFFYNYGAIATIILIIIFVRVLFLKIPDKYIYLKYFSGAFLLFNIASAPCQGNVGIIPFVCSLYLVSQIQHRQKYAKTYNEKF